MIRLVPPIRPLRITSGFGRRRCPISGKADSYHPGVDYSAADGQEVYAAADGRVLRSYLSTNGPVDSSTGKPRWLSYGECILIDHGDSCSLTRYAHLSVRLVKEGDTVSAGALIGLAGSTGASTGVHLHFELSRDGRPVDPAPFFVAEDPHG
jgi:murein DD-endopeptidase MepM/ murein hydrolase activator NlpD